MKTSKKRRPRRLQYEPLEARQMMAISATLSGGGVLTVNGSDSAETVNLKQTSDKISISGVSDTFKASKVKSIVVNLKGGDDILSLNSLANGGNQVFAKNITVAGSGGDDTVRLANGKDVHFSGANNTLFVNSTGGASMNGAALNFSNSLTTSVSNGVLTVFGTNGDDNLKFFQYNGYFGLEGGAIGWFQVSAINSVVVRLQEGDDYVSVKSLTNGGDVAFSKQFTIYSGDGDQSVQLASGDEVTFSGWGHTTAIATNGSATLDGQQLDNNQVQASFSNGVLTVNGTNGNDNLKFFQGNGYFGLEGGAIGWFQASAVTSVVVNLKGGDDYVSLASKSNGGWEDLSSTFTINSGAGNEIVRIANGTDVTFSGAGHQLVAAAAGLVTLDGQVISDQVRASFSNGVLTVTGTNGNDDLKFFQGNGYFGLQGGTIGWFQASAVTSVVVNLRGGDDYVSLASRSNGGWEDLSSTFTINSGLGNETVRVANGNDVTFSGTGHQLVATEAGLVTLDGQVIYGNPTPPPPLPPPPPPPPPPPVTNWFDSNVIDSALRTLGHNLYTDGLIDRNDLISLLRNAGDGNTVDATELADLRAIVANSSLFGSAEYVWKLGSYVVSANAANAKYQGQTLGNLAAGSATAQLEKLVDKWFLGLDRPTAGGTYRQAAGQLFVGGVAYTDVHQGTVGDCYFVASLAETALKNASVITNMFTVNGDGTYTVKFYNSGQAQYVTVDSYLPTNGSGQVIYAGLGMSYNNSSNELWVALAEKAYVQINEMGWLRGGLSGSGQNAYSAIEGGYIYAALGQITGQATVAFASTTGTTNFNTFVTAFNAGKSIGFASKATPASSSVVGSHAYAVVGYNATNQTITLFNPWGIEYGLVTMTWSQIQGSFSYFDRTA